MARLRVYDANGGDVYELMKRKKEGNQKRTKVNRIRKRIVKRKVNTK
jgi:hypothetical protein